MIANTKAEDLKQLFQKNDLDLHTHIKHIYKVFNKK